METKITEKNYTLVFEISNQETSETFINKVNKFYEKRYAEFELDEDLKKTTTFKIYFRTA